VVRHILPALAVALAVPLGTTGCVATGDVPHPAHQTTPSFDPIAFFSGRMHGDGLLHVVASRPRRTDVTGRGTPDGADAITLGQDVIQGDRPATHRTWRLRRIAPGRYAGSLTDAIGPVAAEADGNRLTIRFAMRHGLRVSQTLYLQLGGRVAQNAMTVRKWGITVARLDERIERLP